MGKMLFWKLVRRSVLAALALFVCLVAAAPAPASQVEGQRYSWDTEPQFVPTDGGERILFSRDSDGPIDVGPWQRLMMTTNDGSYTYPYKQGTLQGRDFHAAAALFDGQIAYESWIPSINETTGELVMTFKEVCLGEPVGPMSDICWLGDTYTPLTDPALSPLGDQLAVEKGVGMQVAKISPFGMSGIEGVPMPPLPEASKPAFSRDGENIVFVGDGSTAGDSDSGIWIVPSDGSGAARRLTGTVSDDPCYEDSAPAWQPFVDKAVFVRNALDCGEDELSGVWRIDPDSTWSDGDWPQGEQLVAGNSNDREFSEPTVSRDGTAIAYVRRSATPGEPGESSRIHLFNLSYDSVISDSGETGINFDSHPSFSASGQYVTFQRRADAEGEPADSHKSGIYRVDADGSDQIQITRSYDFFQEGCCAPPEKPKLKLRVQPSKIRMKADRPRNVQVRASRTGNGNAREVKICAKGPRILRFGRKCHKFGALGVGSVLAMTEPVVLKRKVKKGRLFLVHYKVSAPGLIPVTAVLRVRAK